MRGRRIRKRVFSRRDAVCEARNITLQLVDDLPLRRDCSVQVFNCLVLMGHTDFKFIEARCICHGWEIAAVQVARNACFRGWASEYKQAGPAGA
mgnify:FL=1